jgi:hypothetical protein
MRSPSSRPRKARHSRNRHSPARSSGGGRRGEQIPTVPAEERPQSNLGGVAGAAPKIHSAMVQQPRAGIDSAEMDHNAAGGCSSAQAAGQTAAHTEATTQKHAAALSALKAEHARAIEQLQSEAEMQASTARRRYGDQVAELEAELGVARAAAEAASGSGAEAAAAMMSKMESTARDQEATLSALRAEHARAIEKMKLTEADLEQQVAITFDELEKMQVKHAQLMGELRRLKSDSGAAPDTGEKHAAALSALKAEHARAIGQLQSEAEMQASTARRRYGDQVAELEAELGVARAAAEAASGSGAKAAVAMMSKMESATRAVAAKDAQLEAAAQAQHALREQKELLAVQHAHSLAARDRDIMVSTTVAPLRSTDENAPRSTDRNAPLRPLRNSGAEERAGRGPAAGGGSHAAARRVVVTARRGGQARGSRNGSSQGRTAARE